MPKRNDIKSILIIGAGPIVIGQACEFDYSGTQACRALKEEGLRVILVNSNPATIMTDPDIADATYIEPIDWRVLEKIIAKEKPDAILPTMGGQTGLNCALSLAKHGVLEKYGVELIGADQQAIDKAEDRQLFQKAMEKIGLETPRSGLAHSMDDAWAILEKTGFPSIIRPSFTMGGSGGGIAYNREEFEEICLRGLSLSPTNELLIDESLIGWKEYEMEVVRDKADNCIIICAIENVDPLGVHTGDSITVAPAQTLTDKEYQQMRDASIAILREVGVETGGSNVQFGLNPKDGRMVVIEMNPRVSRSSALASKATGFPIAKVAAKLAIGYTLDELKNEITGGKTPASFEPSIDYVVTKIPRFNFEKFPNTPPILTTQMKSVGEVMAIGHNFQESLQKALRGLEVGINGLQTQNITDQDELIKLLRQPTPKRLFHIADAFRLGMTIGQLFDHTQYDPWFLAQIKQLIDLELELNELKLTDLSKEDLFLLKQKGFSDGYLANLFAVEEKQVRDKRWELGIHPVYKRVDTCAAEFPTNTAYMYSTYEAENECDPSDKEKIIVLGGGPNRIGQGIEFDYCCVHAALAMRECGYETIMVNCNPETVSTDFDISDRLYFEPLTLEDVLEIVQAEKPKGVIVQYGGQTPLKLARQLKANGVPIIGTAPEAIDRAEDRDQFQAMIDKLGLQQPANGIIRSIEEGKRLAKVFQYPLLVRPSFVLGGRAMKIIYKKEQLYDYLEKAEHVSADAPLLLDQFLDEAIEVDVDAVSDGENVYIGGVLEHIEQAGVHSGDSSCTLPPYSLSPELQQQMCEQVKAMALELGVVGLINTQFAIKDNQVYVIEVNPRASRTVPFIAKATGVQLAKMAAKAMVGQLLTSNAQLPTSNRDYYAVKQPVFPFNKFPGVDATLGPEMRSTGEVMGVATTVGQAFAKASLGKGQALPKYGTVFLSVRNQDKSRAVELAQQLIELGFAIVATRGTYATLEKAGVASRFVNKVHEGRPHIVDIMKNNEIKLVINTTDGELATQDSHDIRATAIQKGIVYVTTLAGARAMVAALAEAQDISVNTLQELHVD